MPEAKRNAEVITLGSGDLMYKEYTDTMPEHTDFSEDTDLLGRIQGGATLEYKGTRQRTTQVRSLRQSLQTRRYCSRQVLLLGTVRLLKSSVAQHAYQRLTVSVS